MASGFITHETDMEVTSLKKTFGHACRVITDVGDFKYVISIQLANVDISLKFQVSDKYPVEEPQIFTRGKNYAPDVTAELQALLKQKAQGQRGRPMIASLVEEAQLWLHQAGLDVSLGRDESSDNCLVEKHSQRGGNKNKKCKKGRQPKEDPAEVVNEKKVSMKTADDVIKRIQWDGGLCAECFSVGYLDRFEGIMEKSFSAFSWEDIASVDYTVLAVPKHRIQHFKYKDLKVWDKNERLDNVFGSTGSKVTIADVMRKYEEFLTEKKSLQEETGVTVTGLSDDEDDLVIHVGHAMGAADAGGELINDYNVQSFGRPWQEKLRPNYFLCMRVTDEDVINGVEGVHSAILEMEPRYAECCVAPAALHITLCTLGLDTPDQVIEACRMLRDAKDKLSDMAKKGSLKVHISGIDNFYNRVLYARVHCEQDFTDFAQYIRLLCAEAGIEIRDNHDFVPHMTLMKTSHAVSREIKTRNIDKVMYGDFEDMDFGQQTLDAVYLCEMNAKRREDGFYVALADVPVV